MNDEDGGGKSFSKFEKKVVNGKGRVEVDVVVETHEVVVDVEKLFREGYIVEVVGELRQPARSNLTYRLQFFAPLTLSDNKRSNTMNVTVTQLIERLSAIRDEHGDVRVALCISEEEHERGRWDDVNYFPLTMHDHYAGVPASVEEPAFNEHTRTRIDGPYDWQDREKFAVIYL